MIGCALGRNRDHVAGFDHDHAPGGNPKVPGILFQVLADHRMLRYMDTFFYDNLPQTGVAANIDTAEQDR